MVTGYGRDSDVAIEYPMSCLNVGCDVLGRHAIPEELYDFVFVRLEVTMRE